MTDELEELRKIHASFAMPSVQTMVSRKSSITNAFVNSLIPVVDPTPEDVRDALRILGQEHNDVRCAYCGDKNTEWDHLRPLVYKRQPTGYISEIGNLVPSCGKCNQSKGNKNWRDWMTGKSPLSPASRNVPNIAERIQRLEEFERWRPVPPINFQSIVGKDDYARYWGLLEGIVESLKSAHVFAATLRDRIAAVHGAVDSRESIEAEADPTDAKDTVIADDVAGP